MTSIQYVNIWVGLGLLPIISVITIPVYELHRGWTKYVTWCVFIILFVLYTYFNSVIYHTLLTKIFNIGTILTFWVYLIVAIIGYCNVRDNFDD